MRVPAAVVIRRSGLNTGDFDATDVWLRAMPEWLRATLGSSVDAITLANTIYVSEELFDAVVRGENTSLLLHELVHVGQWRREGRLVFLGRYVGEYLCNRVLGLDHATAYRAISFEAVAFDVVERATREAA